MKKFKNTIISLIVLAVALASLAMAIAALAGKFNNSPINIATETIGKHFDAWKKMPSSDWKNFIGMSFFGGILGIVFSTVVAFFGVKWTINSIKGTYNVGIIKFIGLLVLVAATFAISVAAIACANILADGSKWDAHFNLIK